MHTKSGLFAAAIASLLLSANTAHALCTDRWADVTILCPTPVPYTGPKKLTPTSRSMPTVGTPGLYHNYGNGYDVQVYLGHNGTGYQDFNWVNKKQFGWNQ